MTDMTAIDKPDSAMRNEPKNGHPFNLQPLPYVALRSASLPRREFLCGPAFQSKHMTLTVAPAGVGKTSLTIAEAVHIAAGSPLFAPIIACAHAVTFGVLLARRASLRRQRAAA